MSSKSSFFELEADPTWIWPVIVKQPVDGAMEERRFKAKFALAPEELRVAYVMAEDLGRIQIGRELLTAALREIYDVVDGEGKPLPLTPELREAMIRNPWISSALMTAYASSIAGIPSPAAQGN